MAGSHSTVVGRIYGLLGPDDVVRYVGQTTYSLSRRLANHRGAARVGATAPVYEWMRAVQPENVTARDLEVAPVSQLAERERHWIVKLGTLTTCGGCNDKLGNENSDAFRVKARASQTARWEDPEEHVRASAKWSDPEKRAQARAAWEAYWNDPNRAPLLRPGGHIRWHLNRGIVKNGCTFCAGM